MTAGNYITLAIFLTTLFLSGLGAYYAFVRKIENRVTIVEQQCNHNAEILTTIAELAKELHKVSSDNETFWKILGPHLAEIIHSPTARERDELVDKFVHRELQSVDELDRLTDLLHEAVYSGRWTGDKKLAGVLLLARVRAERDIMLTYPSRDRRRGDT